MTRRVSFLRPQVGDRVSLTTRVAALLCMFASACFSYGALAQQNVIAATAQPRSFGYLLGDVISQRVLLRANDRPFEPATLPPLERTGAWLERRAAKVETDAGGERWLVLEYQVINAPQTLTAITLPALMLRAPVASSPALAVAAWPVSVAPLTPRSAFAQGSLQDMQPDRQPSPLPIAPLRQRLIASLAVLAFVACAWLGWWLWRNRRDAGRLPFARACRALERLDAVQVDREPDAWVSVHRALNEAAGQALHAGTLGALFVRAPYLSPLRERLERFYAQSAERFFAVSPTHEPYRLLELARELRLAERRHHR
ncbi:calcium incorporation protein MxaA [Paraburkholderia terricola]|uniref:calcium incorporation protein MxaA n=1 Tax=Paraburkholderia terricola TaxID=169427 RepID=UPI0012601E2C|nr:calcium incorporation protein MxaA [Paraburkholderia terricola]